MPGKLEFTDAAFQRRDDLIRDVLMNVEAFFGHGGFPFCGPRDCGLVGTRRPGP